MTELDGRDLLVETRVKQLVPDVLDLILVLNQIKKDDFVPINSEVLSLILKHYSKDYVKDPQMLRQVLKFIIQEIKKGETPQNVYNLENHILFFRD